MFVNIFRVSWTFSAHFNPNLFEGSMNLEGLFYIDPPQENPYDKLGRIETVHEDKSS